MVTFPHGKINLGLHVVNFRPDGYHDIDTCFYPIPITDVVEIVTDDRFSLTCTGTAIPGDPDDNLCAHAYNLVREAHGIPDVAIHLHKAIPMGAGLGGGSTNATFVLKMLDDLFNLQLTAKQLHALALKLGSDCPFFVDGKPALGTGRGEVLKPCDVDLSGLYLLVVVPPISISTREAFGNIVPRKPKVPLEKIISQPVATWQKQLTNDFEESVFQQSQGLADIKQKLYKRGAIYASLTGTGSAIYGIFEKPTAPGKDFRGCSTWELELA